jgi:hypothetical protein
MHPVKKSADILLIADQERLHALFEPNGELAGARIRKAFNINDGVKSAAVEAPSLLFFQGRMGGLSAEIIARYIRLELKDSKTRMVMFCAPEEIPDAGIKYLYATIDSSLSDGQLSEQVWSVVASLASGGKKTLARVNKRTVRKTATRGRTKPGREDITDNVAKPAKQTGGIFLGTSLQESPDSGHDVSVSAENTEDIVEISSGGIVPADPGEDVPPPAAMSSCSANFRDTLECALEKAAKDIPAANPPPAEPESLGFLPELADPEQGHSPLPIDPDVSRGIRVRTIVVAVSVLSLCGLIFLFYGLRPSVEKNVTTVAKSGSKAVLEGRSGSLSGLDIKDLKKSDANPRPVSAKKQRPEGYMGYKVRRGDTVLYILTERFGLSARKAANMLPEILEKNDIDRNTVLEIGQTIFIPASLKSHHVPDRSLFGASRPVKAGEIRPERSAPSVKRETDAGQKAPETAVPARTTGGGTTVDP